MLSLEEKKDKRKEMAQESYHIQRARQKLTKRLEMMHSQVTKEALEKTTIDIHRWIARHAKGRVSLKDESISLFDENNNPAASSPQVAQLVERFKKKLLL